MVEALNILLLEDNALDAELAVAHLQEAGIACCWKRIDNEADYRHELSQIEQYDLILADFNLPNFDGMSALALLRSTVTDTPFILVSGAVGEELAIESLKAGATDYVLKDRLERLVPVVERALQERQERRRRQEAEKKLRDQRALLANQLEATIEAVLIVDNQGDWLYYNQRLLDLWGIAAGEAATMNRATARKRAISLLANPEKSIKDTNALYDEPEKISRQEVHFADGRVFDRYSAPVTNGVGERFGRLFSYRDITERKRLEEQLQLSHKLEAIGQLTAGIAHDFNNILAVVSLYTELVLAEADLERRHTDRLQTILQQTERGVSLINQILDFSRRTVMSMTNFELVPFVEGIVQLLQRTLSDDIVLIFDYDDRDYTVHADPTRFQQVIMNLGLNARDAMPGGGELKLSLRQKQVQAGTAPPLAGMEPGRWIELTIADNGQGIADEHLAYIFDPFYTTKPPDRGTGLGLAQVYGIIKQHDGHIDVCSQIGRGTTFTIYLPLVQMSESFPIKSNPNSGGVLIGNGESVLLVEDNEVTRQAVAEALLSLNYQVVFAANGEEALQLLQNDAQEIDLVLSDLVMPGMGGEQLYEALRASGRPVRFLVMTGYPLVDDGKALLEKGIVAWLTKPFTTTEIAGALRQALNAEPTH